MKTKISLQRLPGMLDTIGLVIKALKSIFHRGVIVITTRTIKDKPSKPISEESENFSSVGLVEGSRNILENFYRKISNRKLRKNETTFRGFAKAAEVNKNIIGSVIYFVNHADPLDPPNLLSNVNL